jgi:GNAT superfamily N-acetyltransferase
VVETTPFPWVVERLNVKHDRTAFDCGSLPLNNWLRRLAGQYDRRNLATVYVAVPRGDFRVAGFYALSSHWIGRATLPDEQGRRLPDIHIPVVLLGQLAVDSSMQRRGLGEYLLIDAIHHVHQAAGLVGVRGMEVHAMDGRAQTFYAKFGFVPLRDDPCHMYLPMQDIRRLLAAT